MSRINGVFLGLAVIVVMAAGLLQLRQVSKPITSAPKAPAPPTDETATPSSPATAALAEQARLATSTDPITHILGLNLHLETEGPSDTFLSAAASTPPAWVVAEAAGWFVSSESGTSASDPLAFRFAQARLLMTENADCLISLSQTCGQVHAALQSAPSVLAILATEQAGHARYLEHRRDTPPVLEDATTFELQTALFRENPHLDYKARL